MLFRLHTADMHKPLLISNHMISDYSQNRMDMLDMKDLLHLGEDRYFLQALVFIPLFHILAIPMFSFMLPIYSFWCMDDFSRGVTRVVPGESGKKMIMHVCWARGLWHLHSIHMVHR